MHERIVTCVPSVDKISSEFSVGFESLSFYICYGQTDKEASRWSTFGVFWW